MHQHGLNNFEQFRTQVRSFANDSQPISNICDVILITLSAVFALNGHGGTSMKIIDDPGHARHLNQLKIP